MSDAPTTPAPPPKCHCGHTLETHKAYDGELFCHGTATAGVCACREWAPFKVSANAMYDSFQSVKQFESLRSWGRTIERVIGVPLGDLQALNQAAEQMKLKGLSSFVTEALEGGELTPPRIEVEVKGRPSIEANGVQLYLDFDRPHVEVTATTIHIQFGRMIREIMVRGSDGQRVQFVRAIGAALKKHVPDLADVLESYDGRAL